MTTYYVSTTGSDSNAGTSAGAAFASIGKFGSVAADYDVCYVEEGTYNITVDSDNVSNGRLNIAAKRGVTVEGYASTPGDRAGLATFDIGSGYTNTSYMPILNGGSFYNELRAPAYFTNLRVIDSATTTTAGWDINRSYNAISTEGATVVTGCVVEGFYNAAFTGNLQLKNCIAKNCARGYSFNRYAINCVAYQCDRSFDGLRSGVRCVVIEPYGDQCFAPNANGMLSGCMGYSSVAVSPKDSSPIIWFGRSTGCGQALINGSVFEGGTYLSGNDRSSGSNSEFTHLQVEDCAIYNVPNADLGNLTDNHTGIVTLTSSPFLTTPTDSQIQLKSDSQELYDWALATQSASSTAFQMPVISTQLLVTGQRDGSVLNSQDAHYPFRFAASGSFQSDVLQLHPLRENK